jgi:hypothetical protein
MTPTVLGQSTSIPSAPSVFIEVILHFRRFVLKPCLRGLFVHLCLACLEGLLLILLHSSAWIGYFLFCFICVPYFYEFFSCWVFKFLFFVFVFVFVCLSLGVLSP